MPKKEDLKQKIVQNNIKTITVKEKDILVNLSFSDVIELDSLVYLEYTNESLIGEIGKVIVSDDRIYLHDRMTARILCFERSGSFINAFGKIGKGPDEYINLRGFSLFNNKVYALVKPARLLVLDNNLNLNESIEIKHSDAGPLEITNMEIINSEMVIFSVLDAPHKFFFFNIKEQEFISHHSPALGPGMPFSGSPFTKSSSNQIFVAEIYNDTVFRISGDELQPAYFVDFDIPISERERLEQINIHRLDIFNDKRNTVTNMYNINSFQEFHQHLMFFFIYNRRPHFYYKNKIDSKVIIFPNNISNDLFDANFIKVPVGFHGNSTIAVVQPNELILNNKYSVPDNHCVVESNPVLVFYHPKFK